MNNIGWMRRRESTRTTFGYMLESVIPTMKVEGVDGFDLVK